MSKLNYIYVLLLTMALVLTGCKEPRLHTDVDRTVFPVKGIDLSGHNGIVDFKKVAEDSVSFVYLKATEGTDFCDAMFARNCEGANNAGIKVGAYHFFRFDAPGHLQAYHFLSAIKSQQLQLPLAIDVEEWKNAEGVPDNEVEDQLKTMIDVLYAAGYNVILYTNRQGVERFLPSTVGIEFPLWISSPSRPPHRNDWLLWQHSHKGNIKGIDTYVDINTFNGSIEKFEEWVYENVTSSALQGTGS